MAHSSTKPYSWLTISTKYISYFLKAETRHQVHSPLVYNLIDNVFHQAKFVNFPKIEQERAILLASDDIITFTDFGKDGKTIEKKISTIAKWSLKSKKYARLLAKTAQSSNAKNILEIGTSLGITTAYMNASSNATITTLEGDTTVAAKAREVWNKLGLKHITCITGNFDITLPSLAKKEYDIIYIDGNHRLAPTLSYFEILLDSAHHETLFIFDDIHYSQEMEQAWLQIKKHPRVQVTIDVFFLGYVYITPSLSKQDYVLRF